MSTEKTYVVSAASDGVRLDKVLLEIIPDTGLRLRRRLCEEGRVLADGKPRKPGYKVRAGLEITITEKKEAMTIEQMGLKVVERSDMFAAVYKPGGVHSASIDGKGGDSVEEAMEGLFPGDAVPFLLNRLDFLTSGLLVVALNSQGRDDYRQKEAAGDIRKFYLAVVRGRLDGIVTVKNALDTDNRKKTRVLTEETDDASRWTDVEVLSHDHDADTTLVRCLIQKGARHQIRAHLASVGHPIVGDPLYGDGDGDELLLHHQRIELPGFSAEIDAPF